MKICIFLMLLVLLSIQSVASKPLLIDKLTSIVNDQIILESDIKKIIFFLKVQFFNKHIEPFNQKVLYQYAKKKIIVDTLLFQLAKKIGWNEFKFPVNEDMQRALFNNYISKVQFQKNASLIKSSSKYSYKEYEKFLRYSFCIQLIERYLAQQFVNINQSEIDNLAKKILNYNSNIDVVKVKTLLLPSKIILSNKRLNITLNNIYQTIIHDLHTSFKLNSIAFVSLGKKKTLSFSNMHWQTVDHFKSYYSINLHNIKKNQVFYIHNFNKQDQLVQIIDYKKRKNLFLTRQLRLKHIILKKNKNFSKLDLKKKINNIYYLITYKGYSFQRILKQFDGDLLVDSQDNDLGWLDQDKIHPLLLLKILKLKKKEMFTHPIYFNGSWHLFQLIDIRYINSLKQLSINRAYDLIFHKKLLLSIKKYREEIYRYSYIRNI
ncbi:MAG: peptidylprolyl isomerase [Buchnera aphidicola (Eriosoma harunire)]